MSCVIPFISKHTFFLREAKSNTVSCDDVFVKYKVEKSSDSV